MPNKSKRILIIGMADSVHLARWLSQFADQSIDFTLFPSSPHRHIHPILKDLIASTTNRMTVIIKPHSMKWLALPLGALDIPFNNRFRSQLLRRLINQQKFDLIHVLELQHAGYLLLGTKLAPNLPKVFITNWGSDIYWFQQFPKHKDKIVRLLNIASFYSAECQRDIEIVKKLGYSGVSMPVIPNSGGIDLNQIPKDPLLPSKRRKIIIKGYTGFVGRALVALKACELAADQLRENEIVIYSASIKSRIKAMKLRQRFKLKVSIIPKRTPHVEMLNHFSEARVYIGISLSDGISTSLLEAMATGCYPIQTNTSCAAEWTNEHSGSLVSSNDPVLLSEILKEALSNDQLVDDARIKNLATIKARGVDSLIKHQSRSFYEII